MKGCCFTGHRMLSAEERARLGERLAAEIRRLFEAGVTDFYAGGALGFDTAAAQAVLSVREKLPVRLHLLLPCRDQCSRWSRESRRVYEEILRRADSVRYICEAYNAGCMLRRNDALVAAADYCVCYLRKNGGGTAYTVRGARAMGLEIINLAEK